MTVFMLEKWTVFWEVPTDHLHMSPILTAPSTWTNSLEFSSRSEPKFSENSATTEEAVAISGPNGASIAIVVVDETTTVAVDATITTVVVDETTSVPGISDNSTTTGHAQNATIPILRSEKPAIDVKHLAPPAEGNNGPMTATTTIEGVVVTTAQVVVSVTTVVAVVTTVPVDVTTTTVEVVVSNVTRSTPTTGRVQNATIPIFPSARRAIDATPPVQEAVEAVANSATTAVDTASRARTVALVTVEMEAVITETKAVDAVDRNATTTIEPIVKREGSAQVMHTINRRVTFARPGNLNEKTIER